MDRTPAVPRFDNAKIVHVRGVDHPESLAVGPRGELYTTGTGCQVYRVDVAANRAEQFATTANRCLGQAVDAGGNLYCAETGLGAVVKVTPDGAVSTYATGPEGRPFLCANYPAFDRRGALYLSDSGDWSGAVNGRLYKIDPGGGAARLWYPARSTLPTPSPWTPPSATGYLVETFGAGIARVAIDGDGAAGGFERVLHMPRHVPDGIAFDERGRLWIACHRPDAIYVFDLESRRLELFAEDWMGEALRGPTDVAFAGPERDVLFAASLDNLVIHRFDGVGVRGIELNHPAV